MASRRFALILALVTSMFALALFIADRRMSVVNDSVCANATWIAFDGWAIAKCGESVVVLDHEREVLIARRVALAADANLVGAAQSVSGTAAVLFASAGNSQVLVVDRSLLEIRALPLEDKALGIIALESGFEIATDARIVSFDEEGHSRSRPAIPSQPAGTLLSTTFKEGQWHQTWILTVGTNKTAVTNSESGSTVDLGTLDSDSPLVLANRPELPSRGMMFRPSYISRSSAEHLSFPKGVCRRRFFAGPKASLSFLDSCTEVSAPILDVAGREVAPSRDLLVATVVTDGTSRELKLHQDAETRAALADR